MAKVRINVKKNQQQFYEDNEDTLHALKKNCKFLCNYRVRNYKILSYNRPFFKRWKCKNK